MYVPWACPSPAGGTATESALVFDRGRSQRVLVLAALFDEANKTRHQTVEIMRRLDAAGIDTMLPDLPGCNESTAFLRDQSFASWRSAAAAAAQHFAATHVLAIRAGAWFAPPALPGWLYAPAAPAQTLRAMLRARIIAAREAGREETAAALLEVARADGVDLAGWRLGAALVRDLDSAKVPPAPQHRVVAQAEIGGPPLWLRAEPDSDPAQADALAALIRAELAT